MIDLERDTWMALQDMSSEDVADAICDSQAIVEAIQSNAWSDVADMVRARVELKAQRLAQVANDLPLTPWVDSEEELNLWRCYRIERQQEALEECKVKVKINPYSKGEVNNEERAAEAIDFSNTMNKRRTLMRSNTDGLLNIVLSPNRTVPSPWNETTGLTPLT